MTKEEYIQKRNEIKQQYGEPNTYDGNDNIAAVKLNELRQTYLQACRRAKEPKLNLKKLVEDRPLRASLDMPIYVDERFLKGLEPWEKAVIEEYYLTHESHSSLAKRFGVERHKITGLFNSSKFKAIDVSVFDQIFPMAVRNSLIALLNLKDSKITLEAARTLNLLNNNQLDLTVRNKPIDDPQAEKMLKELGDKLIQENKDI